VYKVTAVTAVDVSENGDMYTIQM